MTFWRLKPNNIIYNYLIKVDAPTLCCYVRVHILVLLVNLERSSDVNMQSSCSSRLVNYKVERDTHMAEFA